MIAITRSALPSFNIGLRSLILLPERATALYNIESHAPFYQLAEANGAT